MVIKVPKNLKKADNFSWALDVVATYATKKRTSNVFCWFGPYLRHPTTTQDDPNHYWAHFKT